MLSSRQQQKDAEETARRVLDVIRDLTVELHPHKKRGLVVKIELDPKENRQILLHLKANSIRSF